jgi:AcrR family transcriptional regulator
MSKNEQAAKQKILIAAEYVFYLYGFKGARTTLIAEQSGVSRTMLHYYFKTKETLFQEVLSATFGVVIRHMKNFVQKGQSLEKVIENLIDTLSNLLADKPGLANFVINILNSPAELELFLPFTQQDNLPNLLNKLIEEGKKLGTVAEELNGEDLMMNIYALCAMPYLAAPYIKARENRNEEAMEMFTRQRRAGMLNFVLKGIKP